MVTDFVALLQKYKPVLKVVEKPDFPWDFSTCRDVVDVDETKMDKDLTRMDFILQNFTSNKRQCDALVKSLVFDSELQRSVQKVADDLEAVDAQQGDARKVMGTAVLARMLSIPRSKTFIPDLESATSFVNSRLKTKMQSLPPNLSKKVTDALADKAPGTASASAASELPGASSSGSTPGPAANGTAVKASAQKPQKRLKYAKLTVNTA